MFISSDINYIRGRNGLIPFSDQTVLKIIYQPMHPDIDYIISSLPYEIRMKCKILTNM